MRQTVLVICLTILVVQSLGIVHQNSVLKNARLVQLSPSERQGHSARRNNGDILKSYLKEENVFNLGDVEELKLAKSVNSKLGLTVHHYEQFVDGVKVFGSMVKAVEQQGELHSIAGTAFPLSHIQNVNTKPSISLEQAQSVAVRELQRSTLSQLKQDREDIYIEASEILTKIVKTELVLHNPSLVRGKLGESHLCYKIYVATENNDFQRNIFVDAHRGIVVDSFEARPSALVRELYQYNETNLIWKEGDPRPPLGQARLDLYLKVMEDLYNLYNNTWGRDGYDNRGQAFRSVDDGLADFNAYFDETTNLTVFNPALAIIDVIAHEFQHAYTEYSDALIYYLQFGALNEAYSDIIGNTVELLYETNATKIASNSIIRTDDSCTDIQRLNATFNGISDELLFARGGNSILPPFGQALNVLASPIADFCTWDGTFSFGGKVALIQRGNCTFAQKVQNALDAGATGVIIVNSIDGSPFNPSINFDSPIWFGMVKKHPSLAVARSPTEFTVSFEQSSKLTNSTRWLVGEDASALRDMWNPPCYFNPDSTRSEDYLCNLVVDEGGVHTNSGVPNKMYALLVDGGSFGGVTVPAIGLEKAFFVYTAAQFLFQDPFTDFAHHALSLQAACKAITGVVLFDLKTGAESTQKITQSDCDAVDLAMDAVKLADYPALCPVDYEPEVATEVCTGSSTILYATNFTSQPDEWSSSVSNVVNSTTFIPRNWVFESGELFVGRSGGLFAPASFEDCGQTGEINLFSPVITNDYVDGEVIVEFSHLPLLEDFFDGGLIEVKVNNAAFVYVDNFTLNGYDDVLAPAPDSDNPNGGKAAFTRSLLGFQGRPIFRTTRFNLSLKPGDEIQVKFILSTDDCYGYVGWLLDSFQVYACGDYNTSSTGASTGTSTGNPSSGGASTENSNDSSASSLAASITIILALLSLLI